MVVVLLCEVRVVKDAIEEIEQVYTHTHCEFHICSGVYN